MIIKQILYWSILFGVGFAFVALADTKVMDKIVRFLFVRRHHHE